MTEPGLGPSGKTTSAIHRLAPVEGLRAYLALWVLVGHALWASGYPATSVPSWGTLIRKGDYAVDVFIIISGFVIFLLLDQQRETYKQFIVRRFFRLFPLFIILFLVAIPLSQLTEWNIAHATQYLSARQIAYLTDRVEDWWNNIYWHVPLHLTMLHGAIPEILLEDSPGAFLDPAWSISLEWQFYLVAPLAYALAISARPLYRLGLCAGVALLFAAARFVLPEVRYGAALPFHAEYFFIGAASYFLYKRQAVASIADVWFPALAGVALFAILLASETPVLFPLGLWIAFLGLILESPGSFSYRLVSPLFTNAFMQYLGRVSYSIYLCHILLIIVIQHALLKWAPQLSQPVHFWILLAMAAVATIAASMVLYKYIELPGINAGRSLARKSFKDNAGAAGAYS